MNLENSVKFFALSIWVLFSSVVCGVNDQQPLVLSEIGPIKNTGFIQGKLFGQLGNQMFQVAACVSLAKDLGCDPIFPQFQFDGNYGIKQNHLFYFENAKSIRPSAKVEHVYSEPFFAFNPLPQKVNMEISGYFQSEKYFKHNKSAVLEVIRPSKEILNYIKDKYQEIVELPNTISLHVRTYCPTPYDRNLNNLHYHYFNGLDYITKAVAHFPQDSLFVVFSDNIGWCKDNLKKIPRRFVFIEGEKYYHDFCLMSLCKDHIISNSSFSWWAAYLNQNPNKKVIAPKNWFQTTLPHDISDLLPEEWIVID